MLKNKPSLETPTVNSKDLDATERIEISKKWETQLEKENCQGKERVSFINSAQIIETLYGEKDIRDKVTALDEAELTLKDYEKLKKVLKLFGLKGKGDTEFYSEESYKLILSLGSEQTYHGVKQELLDRINQFNRSKKAHILSVVSTVDIAVSKKSVHSSLKEFFNLKRNKGMAYYLPLKNNRFSVTFSDSDETGNRSRKNFDVHKSLNLTDLVTKDKILKIFVKGNELERSKYKFNLISASIGTGNHYYLYKRIDRGNNWKKINDDTWFRRNSGVSDKKWDDIKDEISKLCETLTYELKP